MHAFYVEHSDESLVSRSGKSGGDKRFLFSQENFEEKSGADSTFEARSIGWISVVFLLFFSTSFRYLFNHGCSCGTILVVLRVFRFGNSSYFEHQNIA